MPRSAHSTHVLNASYMDDKRDMIRLSKMLLLDIYRRDEFLALLKSILVDFCRHSGMPDVQESLIHLYSPMERTKHTDYVSRALLAWITNSVLIYNYFPPPQHYLLQLFSGRLNLV